jgi:tetratricopeptide (TPR) repeat protein
MLFLTTVVFLLQGIYSPTRAQYFSYTEETDSLIALGMKEVHSLRYDSAIAVFKKLIDLHPDHPMGYFYVAAIYDLINQNYRITVFEDEYEKAIDLAIKKGEEYLRKNRGDAIAHFYLGGAYGFRGLHRVRKRQWIQVFIDGYKGLRNLQKSLALRPDLYDAYYGLGLYHYWRSAMAGILRFLPIVQDKRQQGIEELKLAIQKGRYVKIETLFALCAVYYNEEMYDSALAINDTLYALFPSDPSALYMRVRILEKLSRWEEMLAIARKLLKVLEDYPHKSYGYLVECHYLIARALVELGRKEEALHHLETAMALHKKRDKKKELEGPLEDYDEIYKNVKKLHRTLNPS